MSCIQKGHQVICNDLWICCRWIGFLLYPPCISIKNRGDTKTALIRVIEGNMNAAQVTAEMGRLVPGKGKWVVEE
jgi:hypothetical protein